MKIYVILALVAIGVISADQVSKSWAWSNLTNFESIRFLNQEWLTFTKVLNRGVIGDRFSGAPPGFIEIYTRYIPSLVLTALAIFILTRIRRAQSLELVGYTLLFSGATSNLWDHWHSIFVVDTFKMSLLNGNSIPFNLADLGICLGTVILVLGFAHEMEKTLR